MCSRRERYTVTATVRVQEPYQVPGHRPAPWLETAAQVRTYAWCWAVPPRCSRYKVEMRTVVREEELEKERLVADCCTGYTRSLTNNTCSPVCTPACQQGVCTKPDTCQCDLGWGGAGCSMCEFLMLYSKSKMMMKGCNENWLHQDLKNDAKCALWLFIPSTILYITSMKAIKIILISSEFQNINHSD